MSRTSKGWMQKVTRGRFGSAAGTQHGFAPKRQARIDAQLDIVKKQKGLSKAAGDRAGKQIGIGRGLKKELQVLQRTSHGATKNLAELNAKLITQEANALRASKALTKATASADIFTKSGSTKIFKAADASADAGKAVSATKAQIRVQKELAEATAKEIAAKKLAKEAAEKGAAASIKTGKAAATTGKAAAKQAGKLAKGLKWGVRALKATTVVLLVAELAVDAWGKSMQKNSKKAMEKAVGRGELIEGGAREQEMRKKYERGGAISGAAQGAGIGALIGAFTGPFAVALVPLFGAIGALVGGIWGWFSAAKDFEMYLQKARFQKAMDNMSDAMDKFAEGTITNAAAMKTVTTSFATMNRNVGGAGIGGAAEGFGAAAINTEKLFRNMGQSADSMDEFESNLTNNFGAMREQGMLQDGLIKEIRAETEARLEAQEKMDDWVQAQIDAAKELARLKGIAKVFDVVGEKVKNFGEVVQAIADPLSAITFGGGIEAGLDQTGRDKGSIARFNKSVDSMSNMAGEKAGTGLGEYSQTVKDQGFLERNMANILTISSASSATGDIKDNVEKQLEAALQSEGHGMSEDMRDHFDKALDAMDAVDLKDMSKLEANVKQFTAAHEEYLETFKKGAKLLDDHNKNLMTMYAAKNKLEIAGVKNQQDIQSVRFKAEQDYLRGIQAPGVDFQTDQADVDADFNARQQMALQEVGTFKGAFGQDVDATTLQGPEAIGKAFQQVSRELRESNRALQDQGLEGVTPGAGESLATETNAQVAANAKLRKQYELLGGVLDKYKNTQERRFAINEKIAQEQKWQESL